MSAYILSLNSVSQKPTQVLPFDSTSISTNTEIKTLLPSVFTTIRKTTTIPRIHLTTTDEKRTSYKMSLKDSKEMTTEHLALLKKSNEVIFITQAQTVVLEDDPEATPTWVPVLSSIVSVATIISTAFGIFMCW